MGPMEKAPVGRPVPALFSHAEPFKNPVGDVLPDRPSRELTHRLHGFFHIDEHRVGGEACGEPRPGPAQRS